MNNIKRIIKTDRLILREWKMSDVNVIVKGLSNFEVAKNLTVPFPYSLDDAKSFVQKHLSDDENHYYFAISLKDTGEVIGGTNLSIDNETGKNAGGIWLLLEHSGMGYGTEVWKARANFAFNELGLDCLYNGYYEFNEKSAKMQKKLGYEIVGKQMRYCPALKKEVVEILTKLEKEKFKNLGNDFKNNN